MDEKHNIIGLITYHAAYNYGSVLQAYATQSTITDMGHDVTVIDYRPLEGERYYERLYWRGLGLKIVPRGFNHAAGCGTAQEAHAQFRAVHQHEHTCGPTTLSGAGRAEFAG